VRAQGMTDSDVKIKSSDIVFYEATEYLDEEQRALVKEIVEYKLRDELARGTNLEDVGESSQKLKKDLKESEEKVEQLSIQLQDEQAIVRNLRLEFDERAKAELSKQMLERRPSVVEVMPCVKVKDFAIQTDPETKEVVVEAAAPKPSADACIDTFDLAPPTEDAEIQTDPMPEASDSGADTEMSSIKCMKVPTSVAGVQTDDVQAVVDPEIAKLQQALEEAQSEYRTCSKAVEQLQDDKRSLERELATAIGAYDRLKAAQESGGPVKIVEVAKAPEKAPSVMIAVQTDTVEEYGGPSEQEQARILKLRDDKIAELQDGNNHKDKLLASLRKEHEALKARLEQQVDAISNRPSTAHSDGEMLEKLEKAEKEAQRLRGKNQTLGDELEKSKETNTMLEIAINELRDKLKCLQEQLRNAGMGHIADRMFDSAGLAEILSNKPLSVFDRLYNDALKRERRQGTFKAKKEQAANAFLATVHHVQTGEPFGTSSAPGMAREMRGGEPSSPKSLTRQSLQERPHVTNAHMTVSSYHDINGQSVGQIPATASNEQNRALAPPTPPAAKDASLQGSLELKINARVRATEPMQLKIGARTVVVAVGAMGTVVQMYPHLGIDWDCLPSVDKMIVQPDMVEVAAVVDMSRSPERRTSDPRRQNVDPHPGAQQSHMPPIVSPGNSPMRPPRSPPTSASDFWPSQGNRLPQMNPQGLTKSMSTPTFILGEQQSSPQRRLPRLASPGPMRSNTDRTMNRSDGFKGLDSVSFIAAAGSRPVSSMDQLMRTSGDKIGNVDQVMRSTGEVGKMQQRGPAGGAADTSASSKSAGNLRSVAQNSRTRSQSHPPCKLVVQGATYV